MAIHIGHEKGSALIETIGERMKAPGNTPISPNGSRFITPIAIEL